MARKPLEQHGWYNHALAAFEHIESQNLAGAFPSSQKLADLLGLSPGYLQVIFSRARKHILPDLGVTLCHYKQGYALSHVIDPGSESPEIGKQVKFQVKHAATRLTNASHDLKTGLAKLNKSTKLGKQVKDLSFELDYVAMKADQLVAVLDEELA